MLGLFLQIGFINKTHFYAFLIKNNYLTQIKSRDHHLIKITPIGKGVLKNIISEINLKKILEIFEKTN